MTAFLQRSAAIQAAITLARAATIAAAGLRAASQAGFVAEVPSTRRHEPSAASRALEIPTADGRTLGARLFSHASPVAALAVHGATAVPQRFYEPFAQAMAEFGFAVLTYDYRGIGASADRPLADDPATMTDWIDDAAAAHGWLADALPQLPLLAVGHSFGGQFAAILDDERPADALVLVGAQSGYFGTFEPIDRGKLWLTWRLGVPALTAAFGYLPAWAGLGEDLPSGVARQWARWCSSPDYMLSEHPEARASPRRVRGPRPRAQLLRRHVRTAGQRRVAQRKALVRRSRSPPSQTQHDRSDRRRSLRVVPQALA